MAATARDVDGRSATMLSARARIVSTSATRPNSTRIVLRITPAPLTSKSQT